MKDIMIIAGALIVLAAALYARSKLWQQYKKICDEEKAYLAQGEI